MNASISSSALAVRAARPLSFDGLRTLVAKDFTEWRRGRRVWVIAAIVTAAMVLSAANGWIVTRLIEVLPADVDGPAAPASLAPMANLGIAIGSQIFVLAAIFAVAAVLVRERESGTLAWVATKPVSRDTIVLSKWVSSSVMLALSAVILPVVATTVVVIALYGMPDFGSVAIIGAGALASVVFYAALGIAAATFVSGQVAVAAIGFGVFILGPVLSGLAEPVGAVLPTSILAWSGAVAGGADAGWMTPIAWAIGTFALVVVAVRRLRTMEL